MDTDMLMAYVVGGPYSYGRVATFEVKKKKLCRGIDPFWRSHPSLAVTRQDSPAFLGHDDSHSIKARQGPAGHGPVLHRRPWLHGWPHCMEVAVLYQWPYRTSDPHAQVHVLTCVHALV